MSGGAVVAVEPGSVAGRAGIRPGDELLLINGHPLRDVLDVQFYAAEELLELTVMRGGREITVVVERDYGDPLGIEFAAPVFDGMRRCRNRCEFCFVAQMPPGLRPSLYIRDDDYRYSVLYGNFVTLTNLTPEDWARLEEQRLSPLYVSVHATGLSLRRRLLGRDDIPDVLGQIDRLGELGIVVHAQVVLLPGVNDGVHLSRTLDDLAERYPVVRSIGIVPVGVTRYHRGGIRPYTPAEAEEVISRVEPRQHRWRSELGVSLAYLADEWYLLTGREVPSDEEYDGYPQVENGVGMVRQFLDDAQGVKSRCRAVSCTLVCGTLAAPVVARAAQQLAAQGGCKIEVIPVTNRLFGESVTVSGLLSGADVLSALRGRELGEVVLLPRAMFSPAPDGGGWRTLDDVNLSEIERSLSRPVFLAAMMSEVDEVLGSVGNGGSRRVGHRKVTS